MKPDTMGLSSAGARARGATDIELRATAKRSGEWSVALRRPKLGDVLRGSTSAEHPVEESMRAALGHLAALLARRLLRRLDTPAVAVHFVHVSVHVAGPIAQGPAGTLGPDTIGLSITLETERSRAEVLAALEACIAQEWPHDLRSLVAHLGAPQLALRSSVQLRVT